MPSSGQKGNWIEISESNGYPIEQFIVPDHYKNDLDSVLIPYGLVQDRTEKLAHDIAQNTKNPLVACCILKGNLWHLKFVTFEFVHSSRWA